jgi:hypothetical protein
VDVEMDEIGIGGRQRHANQDPAPKCSRRNAGSPTQYRACLPTISFKVRHGRSGPLVLLSG